MNTRSNQVYEHLEIAIKPKKTKKVEKKRVKKWKKVIIQIGNYKAPKWIPSEYYEENETIIPRQNQSEKKEIISPEPQIVKSPESSLNLTPKSPSLSATILDERPEDDFDSLLSPR